MSIVSITKYTLYCNGRRGDRICFKEYRQPADLDHHPKPGELRKLAAMEGWTVVRSSLGRRFDNDYCPEHKPEDTP